MTEAHRLALTDWLACAARGKHEPAARAARTAAAGDGLLGGIVATAAAGHVLDFDDTYAPGLAHLSAATAPAALMLGARIGASALAVLTAYAAGFEAMGTLARICHPRLYDGGWHPTAVCGGAGAAVAASRLLGLDAAGERTAVALALLRAGGSRAGFGSDGKALGVGMACAAGVHAAQLAAAGAAVDADRIAGSFAETFGTQSGADTLDAVASAPGHSAVVAENWIKAYPCCLQTHAVIDAALAAGAAPAPATPITVAVHPLSRRAAALDEVADGLQAKFSIPYLTAYALLRGAPDLDSFAAIDAEVATLARRIQVRTDPALHASEAILEIDGADTITITAPRGCPGNRMDGAALAAKVRSLAGDALNGALDDLERPAMELVGAAGLAYVPPPPPAG